jgi:hypothetical protein
LSPFVHVDSAAYSGWDEKSSLSLLTARREVIDRIYGICCEDRYLRQRSFNPLLASLFAGNKPFGPMFVMLWRSPPHCFCNQSPQFGGDGTLHRSLSIVLPVRNAQSTLRTDVCRLMDVMPDLAGPLEVLVIDDGSNDGTEEVAWELLTSFPQFDFIRNPLPAGLRQSLRTAYEMTRGHHLLIHCGDSAVPQRIRHSRRLRLIASANVSADPTPRSLRRNGIGHVGSIG